MSDVGEFFNQLPGYALTWLPLVFFGAIIYLLWRTLQYMPRVKAPKLEASDGGSVSWADVAGVDEAKSELREVVDFLRHPKRFQQLGARVPKGILLYGPPGTGKTLLAKAVAKESGAKFYSQSASAFVEMFAGLGAARIRKLFEEARRNAPAIVFIDELDAVGTARAGGGFNREHDQTLNQLLVELDGFDESAQVIVMGASNRLQDLDPALLRPGRFDRQVVVAPPDLAGREEILRVHTRGKPLDEDVDLNTVARHTSGLTGADLANLCNEAAIFAGRQERMTILAEDFEGAMERVVAGLQQRRVVTEKEKRILAYHEGGHALLAHLMGDLLPIQKVTIIGRGDALGYAYYLPLEERYLHTKEEFLDVMKVALAGRAAEQIVFGRVTNGASNDLEKVTEIARAMVFEYGMSEASPSRTMRADNYALSEETKRLRDSEQARLTDHAYEEAQRLLIKHRASLDRLAAAAARARDAESRGAAGAARRHRAGVTVVRDDRHRARSPGVRPSSSIDAVGVRGIHHLGVAVHDLDDALDTYGRLFGAELEHRARVEEQGVEAAAVLVGSSRVELLAALGEETPVGRFLADRGPGMHHVAYEVDDVLVELGRLSAEGAELIDEEPRQGLFGLQVAFVHPDAVHGVLTEVVSVG